MVVAQKTTLRYAISDLGNPVAAQGLDATPMRRMRWRQALHRWALNGVHFVQLREKALDAGELLALTRNGVDLLHHEAARSGLPRPCLLLNGRPDVAAAARADGVHLTSSPGELRPAQVRDVFRAAGLPACTVSLSCHTLPEVATARDAGADLILFGPVFEKRVRGKFVQPGTGLAVLEQACRLAAPTPVLALGGVSDATSSACLEAGAAGIAAIRLFS